MISRYIYNVSVRRMRTTLCHKFGIITGPATMGLKDGSDLFFLTSAATALCFILLHTFWSVIFFSAMDNRNYIYIAWVLGTHMIVSCLTLFNQDELYVASLLPGYCIMVATGCMAYYAAGGTFYSFVASLKFH